MISGGLTEKSVFHCTTLRTQLHSFKMKLSLVLSLVTLALSKPVEKDPEYGDLWDGDIETVNGKVSAPSIFNAVWDKDLLWKAVNGNEEDNVLFYDIIEEDYDEEQLGKINAGILDLIDSVRVDGELCVDLRRVHRDDDPPENYVLVQSYSGCSSYIGRVDAAQRMSLTDGCVDRHGTIIHEFLHALGFHHEHKRADRDDYVTINFDNIEPGKEHNFEKLVEGETVDHLGTTYDYGSVLHYSSTAFAIDPSEDTITPHDPDADIGQRLGMSQLDIERVQILYGCIDIADSKHYKGWTMEDIFKPLA